MVFQTGYLHQHPTVYISLCASATRSREGPRRIHHRPSAHDRRRQL